MNTRGRSGNSRTSILEERSFRFAPIAQAIALTLVAGGVMGSAHAQRAFSGAWFAAKGATQSAAQSTGRLPNGMPVSALTNPSAQQQQASAELQRSIANLGTAAQSVAAMQAAQASARAAAASANASVPDGLTEGGLKVDTNSLTRGWINANAPEQTVADGKTTVAIQQTADKAVLNWETFNVGRSTMVDFHQQADWAALNRVNDPQARPSQIQGKIRGDGTVMIVNRNGVIFSGTSQVDTRNLVAAAARISDSQFTSNGIYGLNGTAPGFTDALGKVDVQAGAQIATRSPATVTQGGGYVLLLGGEVSNAGTIATPRGQTALAAGDSFVIRRGVGTDGNTTSSTRGNEIAPQFVAGGSAGKVVNSGLIMASEGDVTLAGRDVQQLGVAVATTTVNTRGTIHLLNSAADKQGRVALGQGAVTAVLIDDDGKTTALDSQRDALIQDSAAQDLLRAGAASALFDNLSRLSDRRDQSRIEIVTGGDAVFDADSLTLATGGQIAVSAAQRSFVANRARLDVSGAVGVPLAMESNNLKINVQGNEQRDAPGNRDSGNLLNANVWIDRRRLIYVPAGTGGYERDRYYTAGGWLEVGGYLGNQGRGIGAWAAQGGTIALGGQEVVTQVGSSINLSGGSLNVTTGYLNRSWLKGADGRLYTVDKAPADMVFAGVYKGFEDEHVRWGKNVTEYYYSPLIAPQRVLENGYTVGRDAGRLQVSAPTVVLEGDIEATVYNGPRQSQARPAGATDGYKLGQTTAALAGTLAVAGYTPSGTGFIDTPVTTSITVGSGVSSHPGLADAVDPQLVGATHLDAARLSSFGLGGLVLDAKGAVTIDAPLTLANGGGLRILAPDINIAADVTARSGSVTATNVASDGITTYRDAKGGASIAVAPGAHIDTRGLWTNAQLDPAADLSRLAWIDGGAVALRSTGDVTLAKGASIDASAGGAFLVNGTFRGGKGGDIALLAGYNPAGYAGGGSGGALTLGGELASYGFSRGGRLSLGHGGVVAINDAAFDLGTSMEAGAILPVDVKLTKDVVWPAGAPLPADAVIGVRNEVPQGVLASDLQITASAAKPLVLTADLVVQPYGFVDTNFGSYYYLTPSGSYDRIILYGGGTIPKGSKLVDPISMFAGKVTVSNGILDLGIVNTTYLQGSAAPVDVTFQAGDMLRQNSRLAVPIAFQSFDTRHLVFETLAKGFSSYSIHGDAGLFLGNDAAIEANMPVLRLTAASYGVATGADPQASVERYLAPVYQENPTTSQLVQRPGADLILSSSARVDVGLGASITVDPGHSVTLASGRQITVDGAITAPGGAISLLDTYLFVPDRLSPAVVRGNGPGVTSMWIGERAVLDVAARAYAAQDVLGRRYGVVADGGSINFGRIPGKEGSVYLANAADAFIVIRPGALLDASGASAAIDRVGSGGLNAASDGGTISLRSYDGIIAEGQLRAAAGGAGASGGRLEVVLESPYFADTPGNPAPRRLLTGRVLHIGQDAVPGALPTDIGTGQIDQVQALGKGAISARLIAAGGFDNVSLWGRDAIAFEGDVTLSAGRSITLSRGGIYDTVAGGNVRLDAPYVFLDGHTTVVPPIYNTVASSLPTSLTGVTGGSFTATAGLLDVRNKMALAFGDVRLASSSDLRFLASSDVPDAGLPTTSLTVPATLTLAAAQVYPASNAVVNVSASELLSIERVGETLPPLPYSAFGGITLTAPTVRQGGVLRAPFGSITLGQAGTATLNTVTELLSGSITSVSGAGLVMPYGGTVDGTSYTVNGVAPITPNLISGKTNKIFDDAPVIGITLNGTQVIGEAGSRLDLSGGGTLLGAAFISGRGGSVDILTTSLANANPANGYSAAGKVYAIVPGTAIAPPAGGSAAQWNGDVPEVGQQVTIDAGVPGLPAGTYTLLPANYALLPGAFRIEIGASTTIAAPVATALPNGSWLLAGTQGVANTAIRDVLPTQFIVTPGAATRSYAQYNEQGYEAFQLAQSATFGTLQPLLPRDGKFLTINLSALSATSTTKVPALRFEGIADMASGQNGWGATLVLPNRAQLLSIGSPDSTTERSATVTPVAAADINAFGAPNLYIGGAPYLFNSTNLSFGIGNEYINTGAITLEPGAILRGAQVTLGAPTITIASGAGIDTIGRGTHVLDFAATGYALGLADYESSKVSIVTASNGRVMLTAPAAVGTGKVSIGDGAVLRSEGTVGIWAANELAFTGTPDIGAARLNLAVSSLNIGGRQTLADAARAGILPAGLSLDQGLLDRLLGGQPAAGVPAMQELVLSAAKSVNFYGAASMDIGVGTLVLNSPAIYGYGAAGDTASLNVDRLVWNGTRSHVRQPNGTYAFVSAVPGATIAGGPGSGQGRFTVNAREIVFGYPQDSHPQPDGMVRFDRLMLGFADVDLNGSERILGNGMGSLSVFAQGPSPDASFKPDSYAGTGGALTLVTPLLTGAAGSSLDLRAGDTLTVTAPAGATAPALGASALGAQMRLFAGHDIAFDTALALPSGRLEMTASGNILLGDRALLDLSGRTIPFFDVTKYSWGGDVVLESTHGNITQTAGSVIDLSAPGSDAGTLSLTATDAAAGVVRLGGT
ncbi:filamentous hemagglutinin N-terminal domain-containing protein, partial [Cupriavidus basilensis]